MTRPFPILVTATIALHPPDAGPGAAGVQWTYGASERPHPFDERLRHDPDQTVLIRGERIVTLDDVLVPVGATLIDGAAGSRSRPDL